MPPPLAKSGQRKKEEDDRRKGLEMRKAAMETHASECTHNCIVTLMKVHRGKVSFRALNTLTFRGEIQLLSISQSVICFIISAKIG